MSGNPPYIAVVDDDDSIRKALSRLLRAWAFVAEGFSSGEEFMDSLRQGRPDCVLLDFQMPKISGLEILKDMRHKGLDIPAIIITAHNEPQVRASCLAAGASAYLCKPIDEAILRRAIAEAIH